MDAQANKLLKLAASDQKLHPLARGGVPRARSCRSLRWRLLMQPQLNSGTLGRPESESDPDC